MRKSCNTLPGAQSVYGARNQEKIKRASRSEALVPYFLTSRPYLRFLCIFSRATLEADLFVSDFFVR